MIDGLDLLITGGTIVDGTGAPGRPGSVGVRGDRLVLLPPLVLQPPLVLLPPDAADSHHDRDQAADREATATAAAAPGTPHAARRHIDATGCIVAPGFIDLHSHGGLTILAEPRHEPKVRQGVTTDGTPRPAPAWRASRRRPGRHRGIRSRHSAFDGDLRRAALVPGGDPPRGRQRDPGRRRGRAHRRHPGARDPARPRLAARGGRRCVTLFPAGQTVRPSGIRAALGRDRGVFCGGLAPHELSSLALKGFVRSRWPHGANPRTRTGGTAPRIPDAAFCSSTHNVERRRAKKGGRRGSNCRRRVPSRRSGRCHPGPAGSRFGASRRTSGPWPGSGRR